MVLVQPVAQAARDEVQVAAREAEHQQRAWATLKTASDSGTSAGSASRAPGAHRLLGHDEHRLQPVRRVEAHRVPVGADDEAAEQRGGDVVGMALELGRDVEQVGVELEQMVGRDEARDERRRAGAEAAARAGSPSGCGT